MIEEELRRYENKVRQDKEGKSNRKTRTEILIHN
jgi:hypothetical protein